MAFFKARQLHQRRHFDLVQHVTYAMLRIPSFMGFLGPRFIFGPVSGGDAVPPLLGACLPLRNRVFEFMRDLSNTMVRWDPLVRSCLARATRIIVTSPECMRLIPRRFQHKTTCLLAVGATPQTDSMVA